MSIPPLTTYDGLVLESAEDILATSTELASSITYFNALRDSNPALTSPPAVAVEVCPAEQDTGDPPQSYPAVRLDIVGGGDAPGVNRGVTNTEHHLEVRVFTFTADRMGSLAAAGKRTLATTANVRARAIARVVAYVIQQKLAMYVVNGVNNSVFNVLSMAGPRVDRFTSDHGLVLRVTILFQVWQRTRSGRFDYPPVPTTLAQQAAISRGAYIWNLTATPVDALTLAGGAALGAAIEPGCEGSIAFSADTQEATASLVMGLSQDRALEMVVTMPTPMNNLDRLLYVHSSNNLGWLQVGGGGIFYIDSDGNDVKIVDNADLAGGEILYTLITYDASAALHTVYTRIEGGAEGSVTASVANKAAGSADTLYFGGKFSDTEIHTLHFAAFYNEIPSAAHRRAQHLLLEL